MKIEVNFQMFCDKFAEYNRGNNFSYDALAALYDWVNELEEATGEEMELDVIALCCDFTEESKEDFAFEFDIEHQEVVQYLENEGALIADLGDTVLYQDF